MMMFHRARKFAAFTLIELLVVVAIIAILISILLPSLSAVRDRGRRLKCASNIRSLNTACIQFAEEEKCGVYIDTNGTGSDSLNHIYPKYIPQTKIALCPSTKNIVRENVWNESRSQKLGRPQLADLENAAAHREDRAGGHSYEVWGWYDGPTLYPDGTYLNGYTMDSVNQQLCHDTDHPDYARFWDRKRKRDAKSGDVIKKHRNVKTPSKCLLVLENDQGEPPGTTNNFPDGLDNHAPKGMNIGYVDGHVKWYNADKTILDAYMESYADPPLNKIDQLHPRLKYKNEYRTFEDGSQDAYQEFWYE